MGKLSGGGFFAQKNKARQQAAAQAQQEAAAAQQQAGILADARVETPVEQLGTQQPVVQPQGTIDPTTIGPDPSELYPAQIRERAQPERVLEQTPTQQQYDVTRQPHIVQTPEGGVRRASPEERTELYGTQLEAEAAPRLPEYKSVFEGSTAGTDAEAIGKYLESAGAAFRFEDPDGPRLFTVPLHKGPDRDATPYERAIESDPQGYIRRVAPELQQILKREDKLNMLEDPRNPNSPIRKDAGQALGLAILIESRDRLNRQIDETDKPDNEKRYANAFDRQDIGPAIAKRLERLLYGSQDQSPDQDILGETSDFGYNYRLSPREQSILGQVGIQFFADSPHYDWFQSKTVKDPATGKEKITFELTEDGWRNSQKLYGGIKQQLKKLGHDRPVSLVKPAEGARLIGEGAYTQKETTSKVLKSKTPRTVVEAKNRLASVPHVVSPHKVLLLGSIFASGLVDPTSPMAKFAKLDQGYKDTKVKEILEVLEAKARKNEISLPQVAQSLGLDPQGITWRDVAELQANGILNQQQELRSIDFKDAVNRIGDVFYYGYTAINNSSRLMITNTELNYQANKNARFVVDGAAPTAVTKGGSNETGFLTVIGRALVPDADKIPLADIAPRMREIIKSGKYNNLARELYAFTEQNKGWFNQAAQAEGDAGLPPPLDVNGINDLFSEFDRDDVTWALDAVHELGKYLNASDGATFTTRVKAEADGKQNGAIILSEQMGEQGPLEKGGVLFPEDKVEIPQDLREYVWETGISEVVPTVIKEERRGAWGDIARVIADDKKLVKAATKLPVMTTIYGKEAKFHRDSVEKFVRENPKIVGQFAKGVDLRIEEATPIFISDMTDLLEHSIKNSLGDVIRHSDTMKRVGRAFNVANRIAEVDGANGWTLQAGGYRFVEDTKGPVQITAGPDVDRRYANIHTQRRVPSGVAAAGAKKKPGSPGEKTTPRSGSLLTNQLKVNGTQNIDATIAQETVNAIPQDAFVMQIYDAFIGDSKSYSNLVETANKKFDEVNDRFTLIKAEREAFNRLANDVKDIVAQKKKDGQMMDIGYDGDYPMMTEFFDRLQAVMNADLPPNEAKIKLKNRATIEKKAGALGYKYNQTSNNISPDNFLRLFNFIIGPELLDVRSGLDKLVMDVGPKRKANRQKRKAQYERLGIETGRQYG